MAIIISFLDPTGNKVARGQDEIEERIESVSAKLLHSSSSNDGDLSPDESEYIPDTSSSSDSEALTASVNDNLSGMAEHPKLTERPRKRQRLPEKWSRNMRKQNRVEGKEYVSTKGVTVPAAEMKAPCKETCRLKCFMIPQQQRIDIFKAYYALADYSRQ